MKRHSLLPIAPGLKAAREEFDRRGLAVRGINAEVNGFNRWSFTNPATWTANGSCADLDVEGDK